MYSKFPFSMENIPRQRSVGCLSLKFGSIVTALIVILYSLLALSQGFADLMSLSKELDASRWETMLAYGIVVCLIIVHAITFFLSAVMLVGALRDKAELVKPWVVWNSMQIIVSVLLFMFFNTMNMINQFADTSLMLFALQFLSILIRFYMLVLVASYYKQLVEDREETERLKNLVNGDSWYTDA